MGELAGLPEDNAQVASFVKPAKTPPKVQKRRPTPKQIKTAKLLSENIGNDKPKPVGEILLEAGYSKETSETPNRIVDSPAIQSLLEEFLPDNSLVEVHKRLLQTRKLEHMVFPLEHQDPSELGMPYPIVPELREAQLQEHRIIDNLSDEDIIDMLAEVNCKVKRIVHGDTARHVYFWAHDAKAQSGALELGYKLKGHLNKDGGGSNFNFNFGTQNFVKTGQGKS